MSNPSYPLWADPSDPGRDKENDAVRLAAEGHGEDPAAELGSEVGSEGEAHDDEVANHVVSAETVERAAATLREEHGPSGS